MSEEKLRLSIDPKNLFEEWQDQAEMTHYWNEEVANRDAEYGKAKSELELVRAELYKQIKDDPEEFSLGKVTETAVNETIIAQTDYQTAQKQAHKAKHSLDVAKAAVAGLADKKRALTAMTDMEINLFRTESRASRIDNAIDEHDKESVRRRTIAKGREREREDGDED